MSTRLGDGTKGKSLRWTLALVLGLLLLSACAPGAIESTPVPCAAPVVSATELAELVGGQYGLHL